MIQDSSNLHAQYPDFSRHWCDTSEQFAGGDALLTALQNHWIADKTCTEEHYWHAGTRLVTVFVFELHNGDETLRMPVLANPYVRRIIREEEFEVVQQPRQAHRESRYEGKS